MTVKEWCIPQADTAFEAKMEDVLDVYQRLYDPLRPVICMDETNKRLIKEIRIPCKPEYPEKVNAGLCPYPSSACLYKAFPPEQARRSAKRFEWHYTPKHGSWLNMAEIEISAMSRQALGKPPADIENFKRQIEMWTIKRNEQNITIDWQFKTQEAKIKLSKLYLPIV